MRTYSVNLFVGGPVTIEKQLFFEADKELQLGALFRSHLEIKPDNNGLRVSCTVHTENRDRALRVAVTFIGRMLDVLTFWTDTPLTVSHTSQRISNKKDVVKSLIEEHEFLNSFDLSRRINLEHTALLRGLNWYRKALYTEDPIDRFFAYWNSISVVAGNYHTPTMRTPGGIINQIWQSFIDLWGEDIMGWPVINGDEQWINIRNRVRNEIAHGLIPVEIEFVEEIVDLTGDTYDVAFNFLEGYMRRLNYWFI